jgi:hypothetical protein
MRVGAWVRVCVCVRACVLRIEMLELTVLTPVLQAFGGEHHWSRLSTPQEIRLMTYLALMHDANVPSVSPPRACFARNAHTPPHTPHTPHAGNILLAVSDRRRR